MNNHSNASPNTPSGVVTAIKVVAIATGVAGFVGTMLNGRRDHRNEARKNVDQQVKRLESLAHDSIAQLGKALDGVMMDRGKASKKARKGSKEAASAFDEALKVARERVHEIDKELRKLTVTERAHQLTTDGSERAQALSAGLTARIDSLLQEARHRAADLGEVATVQAAHAAEVARERSDRARSGLEPKRAEATRIAHDAADHAREIAPEVRVKLAAAASTAAERGGEAAAIARERAPDVLGSVASALSTATHDLQERASPVLAEAETIAGHAAEQARAAVREAGKKLPEAQHQAEAIGERFAHTTHALEDRSRHAASAAGQGSKDFGALLIWSGVAAALAYVAFLDEEQRAKVRESAGRVWAEAREVYNDIRGYDEEFT